MLAFERKLNLLVGVPSTGTWTSGFGICLGNMMAYLMSKKVPGFRDQRVQEEVIKGSILPRARGKLVQRALNEQFTHLLFIDTDQTFPRDTAHRLLQARKDVIGCNIATKTIPASPTARRKAVMWDGEPVYTDRDSPQYEEVWRLGAGIMLIDVRVFQKIGPSCFGIPWIEEIQDYQGEDWSMCEAMERAGFRIWVDHKLSDEVGHLGEFKYTHEVVGEKKLVEVSSKKIGEA